MELKKRFNSKCIFIGLYFVAFLAYIIYGLQPVEAAQSYEIADQLEIPSIALDTDVAKLQLEADGLHTPDKIVGSYTKNDNKTLLIGHSTTVFRDLDKVDLDATIIYSGQKYRVTAIDMEQKDKIDMSKLLQETDRDTLVIMTCAGKLLEKGDATHRLIITAVSQV